MFMGKTIRARMGSNHRWQEDRRKDPIIIRAHEYSRYVPKLFLFGLRFLNFFLCALSRCRHVKSPPSYIRFDLRRLSSWSLLPVHHPLRLFCLSAVRGLIRIVRGLTGVFLKLALFFFLILFFLCHFLLVLLKAEIRFCQFFAPFVNVLFAASGVASPLSPLVL